MNNKKTILHIIQNFGRGGAETAVVGVLKNLSEYNNIVVTLDGLNEFGNELKYDKYYALNLRSYYLFPFAIKKLRKIIKEEKVDIVHSQLYWSTILARFATPLQIPLVTSIQASLTNSTEYKKGWIGWLDKYSYNKRPSLILGVSEETRSDYFKFLKLKPQPGYVLYNFVDTKIFAGTPFRHYLPENDLKMVTVGSLKPQKNHPFLLEAMDKLKHRGVTLDIYGDGLLKPALSKYINDHKLPVRLMGKVNNIQEVIGDYDLFVMPSLYEGFSLAVLEGMAMEKPMLLSNIPTFTEQAADTALYFSLDNTSELIEKILFMKNNPNLAAEMAINGKKRALQYFTLDHHMKCLREIYKGVLAGK